MLPAAMPLFFDPSGTCCAFTRKRTAIIYRLCRFFGFTVNRNGTYGYSIGLLRGNRFRPAFLTRFQWPGFFRGVRFCIGRYGGRCRRRFVRCQARRTINAKDSCDYCECSEGGKHFSADFFALEFSFTKFAETTVCP